MLAFAQGARGQRLSLDTENLTAYAAMHDRAVALTIINKDGSQAAAVNVALDHRFTSAKVLRLTAPSLASKEGVTLGRANVSADGEWKPTSLEALATKNRECVVHVPAASAVIVTFVS